MRILFIKRSTMRMGCMRTRRTRVTDLGIARYDTPNVLDNMDDVGNLGGGISTGDCMDKSGAQHCAFAGIPY